MNLMMQNGTKRCWPVMVTLATVLFFCSDQLSGTLHYMNEGQQQMVISASRYQATNDRPIIGILAQELHENYNQSKGKNKTWSYIAASYVKFIELAGARVVPIHINRSESDYETIMSNINGVLLPGGAQFLNDSLYAEVGKKIIQLANQMNDKNIYFPIWAICLGFELLSETLDLTRDVISDCSAFNVALPLNLSIDFNQSRLMKGLPPDILQALINFPVTANFHHRCLTPESVASSNLHDLIHILSTNQDQNGATFVSTYEVLKYPYYAVQWHPEKAPFEWTTNPKYNNIPHSLESIKVAQYFANFFVAEARRNNHVYDPASEMTDLIYNINKFYSGKLGSEFEEIYRMGY